jgi:hypothetical protein
LGSAEASKEDTEVTSRQSRKQKPFHHGVTENTEKIKTKVFYLFSVNSVPPVVKRMLKLAISRWLTGR